MHSSCPSVIITAATRCSPPTLLTLKLSRPPAPFSDPSLSSLPPRIRIEPTTYLQVPLSVRLSVCPWCVECSCNAAGCTLYSATSTRHKSTSPCRHSTHTAPPPVSEQRRQLVNRFALRQADTPDIADGVDGPDRAYGGDVADDDA